MTDLSYHLSFDGYHDHLVRVRMAFIAPCDSVNLWLPTWIAGSYLIREFSKHIAQVQYTIGNNSDDFLSNAATNDDRHLAQKINKNTFTLPHTKKGDNVSVCYDVYCHDLSVRTAFVDSTRLFGNFTSLLMMVSLLEQTMCRITLSVPDDFLDKNPHATLATGLPHDTHYHDDGSGVDFVLHDIRAFDSYDYPFEISEQVHFEFDISTPTDTIRHRFFIAGRHDTNTHRLSHDIKKICQSYVDWLGDTPFDDYTFMTMATGSDYGGLEHINSTALITPRADLPSRLEQGGVAGWYTEPSAGYQRFLGLCSHEYFHAWWVKTVRPDVMMDNDLTAESYTPLLWVFEGFTSYLDDLMLLRSGVISKDSYLMLLAEQINRYAHTDGKAHQSVAESSFDAWIKLYRPDENTNNQGVSYYNKGALVALVLDLLLMEHGHRLFDVVKHFYELSKTTLNKRYGLSTDELGGVVSDMMGADNWQAFYENYIIGTSELPIHDLLSRHNIAIRSTKTKTASKYWGMTYKDDPMGLKISHLQRDCIASRAGLSVGDVIIAIDGIKATKDHLNRTAKLLSYAFAGETCVHVFRRDELMSFDVKVDAGTLMRLSTKKPSLQDCTLLGDGGAWLSF